MQVTKLASYSWCGAINTWRHRRACTYFFLFACLVCYTVHIHFIYLHKFDWRFLAPGLPCILRIKKNSKIVFTSYKKIMKQNYRSREWCIPQPCKISVWNILYIKRYKNEKSVDLSSFKSPKKDHTLSFLCSSRYKNISNWDFCTIVEHIISYFQKKL
jgi:hypothetical protein